MLIRALFHKARARRHADRERFRRTTSLSDEGLDAAEKLAIEMAKCTMMSPSETHHLVMRFLEIWRAGYRLRQAAGVSCFEDLLEMGIKDKGIDA
jgi:hypothetical protein